MKNSNSISLSILAPCYNEEKNLNEFYDRINTTLKKLSLQNYEIIFIDDGSGDKSWDIIKEKRTVDKNVKGIKLQRNFGHQNAILAGLKSAKGTYTLVIDTDLQDPPELIEKLYNKIIEGNSNIISCQRNTRKDSFFKKITASIFYYIFNLLSKTKIKKQVSDFKIFDRKVLGFLNNLEESDPFLRGLIVWPGFKEDIIVFDRDKRNKGRSGWSLSKMFDFSLNAFFGFSNLPMRLSFIICFLLSLIFLIFALYALISYFSGNIVRGWTSIFLIIVLFNIFNFFILGLISEFTGRIYLELKKRPRYVIEETLPN